MALRLIGTDDANPRLPVAVINATQGPAHADLAPGDVGVIALFEANAYTDQAIADVVAGGIDFADGLETLAGTSTAKAVNPAGLAVERPYFDVRSFGAVGDGVTNATAGVQGAIDAANAAGGGQVLIPRGTWSVTGLTLYSNIRLVGVGRSSVVKLAAGANTDLIISDGFAGLTGGTTTGGIENFGLADLTLDGNRAANTTGWVLRVYGRAYRVDNVWFGEGASGGVWTQWGAGGSNMEAHWSNFKIYNCLGVLLDHNGPHDSMFVNGSIFNDGTQTNTSGTLLYVRGQSSGSQFTNIHCWGNCTRAIDVINGTFFTNCQAEGATTAEVRFQQNYSQWTGGHIFGTTTGTESGIELGVAAVTSAKGNQFTNVMLSRFAAGSFPIRYTNSAGYNVVTGQIGVSVTAAALWTGTPNTTAGSEDRVDIRSASPAIGVSWAVPKLQSRRLFIPASAFSATSGTPSLTNAATAPVWAMDAAAVEIVGSYVIMPSWFVTFQPFIWWANAAAGTGDVRWLWRYDFITAGETLTSFTTAAVTATAGAVNVIVRTSMASSQVNNPDQPLVARIERGATDAADTLANDANFIGLELVQIT